MQNYTQEEIMERFRKLPQDLKDAIFSIDTAEALIKIGEKHKLLIDKMGEAGDETGRVLIGLTHPKDFVANLAKRLGADIQTAKNIAEDINNEIFFKVRDNLKKIHGIHEEPEEKLEERLRPEPSIKPPTEEVRPLEPPVAERPAVEIRLEPLPATPKPISSGTAPIQEIQEPTKLPEVAQKVEKIEPPRAPEEIALTAKTPEPKSEAISPAAETKKAPLPPPELPVEPETKNETKIPPLFASKTDDKVFSAPPQFSEKNQALEELNETLEDKSLVQKLKESKEADDRQKPAGYKDNDPYRELIE